MASRSCLWKDPLLLWPRWLHYRWPDSWPAGHKLLVEKNESDNTAMKGGGDTLCFQPVTRFLSKILCKSPSNIWKISLLCSKNREILTKNKNKSPKAESNWKRGCRVSWSWTLASMQTRVLAPECAPRRNIHASMHLAGMWCLTVKSHILIVSRGEPQHSNIKCKKNTSKGTFVMKKSNLKNPHSVHTHKADGVCPGQFTWWEADAGCRW